MEKKALTFVLMFVVVEMLAGQSNAWPWDFKKCIKDCVSECSNRWSPGCRISCFIKCIFPAPDATTTQETTHQFCTVGCATSLCSKLITKDNLDLNQVESCVNGCSGTCAHNYVPSN